MSGPGLVKKLLFPAYADAGPNITFAGKEDPDDDDSETDMVSSTDDQQSEATTAVHDNRTTGSTPRVSQNIESGIFVTKVDSSASKQAQIRPQVDDTLQKEFKIAVLSTSNGFFPSTAPPVIRPINTRGVSTTTRTGTSSLASPTRSLEDATTGEDSREKPPQWLDEEFVRDSRPEGEPEKQAYKAGIETRHQSIIRLDEESIREHTAESARGEPLNGGGFDSFIQQKCREESRANVQADSETSGFDNSRSDADSDVLSTASEMGTVINASSRLADVNAMALLTPIAIAEEDSQSDDEGDEQVANGLSLPLLDDTSLTDDMIGAEAEHDMENNHQSSSATALVSAAFRRIGTGTFNRSGSVSAPSTPRAAPKVEDYLKSAYRSGDKDISQSLRSPGSAAYFKPASREAKPILSPLFAPTGPTKRINPSGLSSPRKHVGSIASPFRFARGCFSFDHTTDKNNLGPKQPLLQPKIHQEPIRLSHDMQLEPKNRSLRDLIQSRSWDIGSTPLTPVGARIERRSLLTPIGSRSDQSVEHISAFRVAPARGRVLNSSNTDHVPVDPLITDPNFSPALSSPAGGLALRTPHRVEIEREDALDILSCLVQRSAAFETDCLSEKKSVGRPRVEIRVKEATDNLPAPVTDCSCNVISEDDKVSTFAEVGSHSHNVLRSPPKQRKNQRSQLDILKSGVLTNEILDAISELKEISNIHDKDRDHKHRVEVLDKLLLSHIYAVEMKRAAHSASTWLRSIGRFNENNGVSTGLQENSIIDSQNSELGLRVSLVQKEIESCDIPSTNMNSFVEELDLLTVRAMLHSAQVQIKQKSEVADRLNEELTKCRAEIGRLKSAANAESSFVSQNRSILDGDDDESDVSDVCVDVMESTWPTAESKLKPKSNTSLIERSNLVNAIREECDPRCADVHTVMRMPMFPECRTKAFDTSGRAESPSHDTYSKVPDGQTFVSKWETESSLPPPPDHDLHSPVVNDLLNQWTPDKGMQHSLLSWIESVTQGTDPNTIPPLTISSLDEEVRDGLLLHVLPFLLKRPDILVDVKTRSQRRTTFDIAVTVHQNFNSNDRNGVTKDGPLSVPTLRGSRIQPLAYESRIVDSAAGRSDMPLLRPEDGMSSRNSEVGTKSVSHSTVTAHVSNSSIRFRPGDVAFTSRSIDGQSGDSEEAESNTCISLSDQRNCQQPGLMSAFNSTFGNFLSRGKRLPSHGQHSTIGDSNDDHELLTPPNSWNQSRISSENEMDGSQPYQRVLSCPPGRIGVTFVQYRGHAMVSDVSSESPLSGWVFPSDILIAIDEVPVSGMRVREIVKLLTARKDRQRALRVISSHAMGEFTINTSVISEPGI